RGQIHPAFQSAASLMSLLGPEVVPLAVGKIELALGCAFGRHGSDQQVSSPEIFVRAADCLGVLRIMQPESPDERHTRVVRFAATRVVVSQQSIAKLEILTADGFDFGIVELARVGFLPAFDRAIFTQVPSPRQMEMPGSSVRPKRWAKRTELE